MNRNINNQKILLLSNQFSPFAQHTSPATRNSTARKTQSDQKILPFTQRQQPLPEISSPFLKQTVYNLFSQKRLQQLQPVIRQTNSNEKLKSKSLAGPLKEEQFTSSRKHQSKRKQIKTQAKEFINEHLVPKRIPKLFNQSKITAQLLNQEYVDMKNSLDTIEKLKNKSKQKSTKNSRTNTEETQQYSQHSQSSRSILHKIHHLQQKESLLNLQARQTEVGLQSLQSKLKQSAFILKQKKSKEMYRQQREHIKMVKEVIENSKGLSLSKGIKVKNYINFLPKIMNIED